MSEAKTREITPNPQCECVHALRNMPCTIEQHMHIKSITLFRRKMLLFLVKLIV